MARDYFVLPEFISHLDGYRLAVIDAVASFNNHTNSNVPLDVVIKVCFINNIR